MLVAALTTMLWAQAASPAPPPPAPAAPPVDLRWDAPAGCPDVEAVRAGIARGLPKMSGDVAMAPLRADVYVSVVTAPDGTPWRAALALQGSDWTATRTLKGPTCAAVADAAVLVVDLAIETELQAREVAVAPPPPSAAPPGSTPVLALALSGDFRTLPSATPGGLAALGWRFTHARVDLRAAWFGSRTATLSDQPTEGARIGLASASLRGCALFGGTVALGPCVAAGVDRLHAEGFGPIAPKAVTNLAPFLGGGLQGEWRLSRWVVPFVTLEAAIPLVRAHFSVEDGGQLHRAAAVSFRGAAGLEVRIR